MRLPGALIGVSAHIPAEAAAMLRAGADYVTVSPVFLTASKPGYGPALGLDGLAAIDRQAAGPVRGAGRDRPGQRRAVPSRRRRGVAVMGEVMRAADPGGTVAALIGGFG